MSHIASVIYHGDLRTEAKHIRSGQTIITDAPLDNNGKGQAFSPTDLAATALATCMITIVGIAARNHGFDIDGTTLDVHKHMKAHPRRIGQIDVIVTLPHAEYTKSQKAIIKKAAETCPVAMSLHPDLIQNLEIVYPA